VEGEGGYFRRNHWVPVPVARDLAALNGSCWRTAEPMRAASCRAARSVSGPAADREGAPVATGR
jgi:hypothetical protein